ncbi:MAG TPA: hypothetical protein PKY78_00165 [Candidatus Omnitrophota bacterium]|nr:hypothetical protein [Candidatus Omnitrophota bacterium]
MKNTIKYIAVSWIVAAMVCPVVYAGAVASVGDTSDSKFVSRIEKKQEFLMCMSQSISELKDACRKRAVESNNESEALSSSKYVERLEKKLGALVKESVQDIGYKQMPAVQAAMVSHLSPASKFDQNPKEGTGKTEE